MATDAVAAEGAAGAAEKSSTAYRSGWLDAVVNAIDRLPVPAWFAFVAIAVAYGAWLAVEAALSSRGLFGQQPAYFAYAVVQFLPLLIYYLLSRGALDAWDRFRPATDCGDAEAARWRLELSTIPARAAALVWLIGAVGYTAMLAWAPAGFDLVGHSPLFVAMRYISEALWLAPILWAAVYLPFRQLRIVSRLHRAVARVDLLRPAPLHAMSRLTARSAVLIMLLSLTGFVPLPNLSDSARLALQLSFAPVVLVSLGAFILPLRGMHGLLEAERSRRQGEIATRIDGTTGELHRVVDDETDPARTRDPDASRLAQVRIDGLNKALASLLQEREFIGRLSTWPWDATTFRAVLSAIALPIVLFLATRALERFVL